MDHLVDTIILARLANTADALHAVAARAVLERQRLIRDAHNYIRTKRSGGRPGRAQANESEHKWR